MAERGTLKPLCPACGIGNEPNSRFCRECGAVLPPLTAQPASPAAPAAPTAEAVSKPSAPSPGSAARLVVIAQDGSAGRRYDLTTDSTDIGSSEGDILLPSDPFVSSRHARISRSNGRFWVHDLDSVNGIYLRLQRPHALDHGDLLLIGLEVLRFELLKGSESGFGNAMERGTQLFGSPITPRHARLCQRTVEGVTRDVFHISKDETTIGRELGDIVFSSDPFMSRRHASINRDPQTKVFTARDLGSSNGTYLAIRGEVEVSHGDHIRIGQHLFRLELQ